MNRKSVLGSSLTLSSAVKNLYYILFYPVHSFWMKNRFNNPALAYIGRKTQINLPDSR